MKAKELIQALSILDPEAEVVINIKQENKRFGVLQSRIKDDKDHRDNYFWVDNSYAGATITVHLPEGTYLMKRAKK